MKGILGKLLRPLGEVAVGELVEENLSEEKPIEENLSEEKPIEENLSEEKLHPYFNLKVS